MKVSYCTMRNMKAIIKSHNAKVLAPPPPPEPPNMCSCPRAKKAECPLSGQCLTKNVVYKATVSTQGKPDMPYYGLASTTFKERYRGHNSDIRLRHRQGTALAKHIWRLKDNNEEYSPCRHHTCLGWVTHSTVIYHGIYYDVGDEISPSQLLACRLYI